VVPASLNSVSSGVLARSAARYLPRHRYSGGEGDVEPIDVGRLALALAVDADWESCIDCRDLEPWVLGSI